jgi:hypothetical protein
MTQPILPSVKNNTMQFVVVAATVVVSVISAVYFYNQIKLTKLSIAELESRAIPKIK